MTTETTTETKTTPEATIHDAIDALFAEKAKETPPATRPLGAAGDAADARARVTSDAPSTSSEIAPAETTTEASPPAEGEAATEPEAPTEPAADPAAAPDAKKVSASDYALKLAQMRKKAAKAVPVAPTTPTPSAEAIKRAAAIEAAGGDAKKAFEAAGLNLADVVKAYEQEVLEGDNPDPLAVEVKRLNARIVQLEGDKIKAESTEAERNFMNVAQKFVTDNAVKFPRVKAMGQEALDIAKHMVLQEGEQGRVLPLVKALEDVEAHFRGIDEKLATTRPQPPKPTTRKPSIPQQASTAAAAPAPPTTARTVSDVINSEIDALFAGR